MARDLSVPIRRATLTYLQGQAALTALVPAARIYPPQIPATPVWPFIQYGAYTFTPSRASCYDGGVLTVRLHVYAKGPGDETCGNITALVASLMDGVDLPIAGLPGCYARSQVDSSQVIQDTASDANSWHGICAVRVLVSAPTL